MYREPRIEMSSMLIWIRHQWFKRQDHRDDLFHSKQLTKNNFKWQLNRNIVARRTDSPAAATDAVE